MRQKIMATLVLLSLFTGLAFGQQPNQIVRGTIKDVHSKLPLIGATVLLP